MKLIVGLGNPEKRYVETRHNAGWMVLDRVASRHARGTPRAGFHAMVQEAAISGEKCLLAKPLTYMNRSGLTVSEALSFYKLDAKKDLMVIVDDLYLPVGTVRVKPGGGDGGHNGLADIRRVLGHDDYPRLRVGVGLTLPSGNVGKPAEWDQADFVLSTFSDEEKAALSPALDRAADACEVFATRGLDAAMNQFNSDPSKARPKKPRPDGPDSPQETTHS